MDKLNNLIFKDKNDNDTYDFSYIPVNFINSIIKSSVKNVLKDATNTSIKNTDFKKEENLAIMAANEQVVENKLQFNDLIYKLEIAAKSTGYTGVDGTGSSILVEKLLRAKAMREIIISTVLSMIHSLYWTNFEKSEKGSMPLSRCFDIAIDIGQELVNKFSQRLDQEYNLANVIAQEFGKKGVSKNVRM